MKWDEELNKPIPNFDALLAQHPIIPLWWDTDLKLDEYLALVAKIRAEHKAKQKASK